MDLYTWTLVTVWYRQEFNVTFKLSPRSGIDHMYVVLQVIQVSIQLGPGLYFAQ